MLSTFQTLITGQIADIVTLLVAVVTAAIAVWAGFHGLKVGLRKIKSMAK